MKSIIKYINTILFLSLGFFITSCEEFLEEDPKDIVSPSNFFNTEAEIKSSIVGLYNIYEGVSLHGKIGLERFYENGADVIGPSREFDQVELIQNYTINEENVSAVSQGAGAPITWQNLYKVILNANIILESLEKNESLNTETKKRLKGEVLFFRAYSYYHITNLWGAAPFYTNRLEIDEIKQLGRTDVKTIRQQIIVDMEEAQNSLPDTYSGSDRGRVTKWAAAMVLAKVYLIQENWQLARDKALDIVQNSPHSLLPNYSDVFDPNNEYNIENIWELDFVKDVNRSDWPDHYSPRIRDEPKNSALKNEFSALLSSRSEGFTGFGLAVPLPDFAEKFPMDDLRRPSCVVSEYLGYELNFPYMPKMWNLDQINSPRGNHGDNRIIFRLADAYLIVAEAENELNGPDNAYQYINKVRERAYEPDKPYSGLTQETFRVALRDERKWELCGEGHRRMDLIRWGILLDVVKSTKYRIYKPAANIQPRHILLPIPIQELNLNPALLESDPTNNGYR